MVYRITLGPLRTNCYVFAFGEECFIVDCASAWEAIRDQVETRRLKPRAILLTHAHLDHMGGVMALKAWFFAHKNLHVPIYLHQNDAFLTGKDSFLTHRREASYSPEALAIFEEMWQSEVYPDHFFREGPLLDSPLSVLFTPGHSPGGVSLYSESENLVFSGDTIFYRAFGRADLIQGSETQLKESVRKILSLPPQTIIYPGHGFRTTVEKEVAYYSTFGR